MAQYNSKHTGSQIDSAVARALAGGAIDQAIAKKMDATESTDYPGCYYKVNNGVKEWINPPMVIGTEYRTTERYKGMPVYVKIITFGANTLGTAGTKTALQYYSSQSDRVSNVVSLFGWNDYKAITLFRDDIWKAYANRKSIIVSSITDLTTDYGSFLIKYTKSSD